MPLFPTFPLNKANVRSLLTHLAQANSGELPLFAADRRANSGMGDRSKFDRWARINSRRTIVATKDPYLETVVTDWVIHFYLSLTDWNLHRYFVYKFLPNYSNFTQKYIQLETQIYQIPTHLGI